MSGSEKQVKDLENDIEMAYGKICVALFNLRERGEHELAFSHMGTLVKLFTQDRVEMIKSGKVKL